jgi:hypothetical protein
MAERAEHSYRGIRYIGGRPWRIRRAVVGYAVVAIIAVACDDPTITVITGRAWLALLLLLQSKNVAICPIRTIHATSNARDTVFSLRTHKWIFGRIGWGYEEWAVEASGAREASGLSRPLVILGCCAYLFSRKC